MHTLNQVWLCIDRHVNDDVADWVAWHALGFGLAALGLLYGLVFWVWLKWLFGSPLKDWFSAEKVAWLAQVWLGLLALELVLKLGLAFVSLLACGGNVRSNCLSFWQYVIICGLAFVSFAIVCGLALVS